MRIGPDRWAGRMSVATIVFLIAMALPGRAEVRLPKMLSAHGVLQRERPIHVWGWSDPKECVRVEFHAQKRQACADELGMWSTYLAPEAAGGPYTLTAAGGAADSSRVEVQDLLVGDVWFASGQSNMEMPLKGFGAGTPVKDSAKEIAAAGQPRIRLLRFETKASSYPLDDVTATWTECTPETAASFSAVAYFFGREIEEHEHVPVGLIDSTWGGTPIESWISLGEIAEDASLMPLFASRAKFAAERAELPARLAAEKREDTAAMKDGRPAPRHLWHPGEESSWNPSYLYNGMIAPATAYTVRGFLWYQGESNSGPERAPLYEREMTALIEDWRARWADGNLPFLYVQLSSFNSPPEHWGQIRDAQRRSLAVANTAMAVSLDVGTPDNVHPPDKQTVAHRLALGARALSYEERVEWSGPLERSADCEADKGGGAVRVWFDHADGLQAEGRVRGFEVAGADGRFLPAVAQIEGKSVLVKSESIHEPTMVRYGYAGVSDANMYNHAGLPAATFAAACR